MGGYKLIIADEVFRARYRKAFDRPEPLTPDRVESYVIDLHHGAHCAGVQPTPYDGHLALGGRRSRDPGGPNRPNVRGYFGLVGPKRSKKMSCIGSHVP
jgi:hypothetical protein